VTPKTVEGATADREPVLLFGPDGERPFDAAALERELRAMWKAARPDGGALYRAALANVILPLDPEHHAPLDPVLVEFTRRHPSRLFRLQRADRAAGDAPLQARATALCHLRPGGGGLICSEQIILTAASGADTLVPSAVASLIVGDLPVVLIRLDAGLSPAADAALEAMADMTVEDSATRTDVADMVRLWSRLASEGSGRVRDIAWARLMPWRELLAEVFDQPDAAAARGELEEVTIHHGGSAPPAGAWLLASWLATRLAWTYREHRGSRFRFDGPRRSVTVRIEREPDVAEPVVLAVHARSDGPQPLDVRIAHGGRDATATMEFLAPRARTLERAFRYREFAACLVGEIHRHEPNESLEHAARLAARLAAAPETS